MDGLQRVAELAALGRAEGQFLHRVEPIADALERAQRSKQPRTEQTPAHRGDRAIDFLEQRSLRTTLAPGDDLEVLQRDRIDDETVGAGPVGDGSDVREVGLLRVAQVGHQRSGGLDRRRPAVEPEAFEAVRLQLIEERAPGCLRLERPGIGVGDRNLQPRDPRESLDHASVRRHDDLARPKHGDLVGRAPAVRRRRGIPSSRTRRWRRPPARRRGAHRPPGQWPSETPARAHRDTRARSACRARRRARLRAGPGPWPSADPRPVRRWRRESPSSRAGRCSRRRHERARRTSGCLDRRRPSIATSASARGPATRRARLRRTSRRSRPCGRTRSHRDTDALRRDTAAWRA